MSENVMISKMENNTKQTLTKDDRFSLYVYLDHFVHQFFFFFFFFCLFIWLCWVSVVAHWISPIFVGAYGIFAAQGIWFPDQGLSLGPLHWEHGVLATGPPGKSLVHQV